MGVSPKVTEIYIGALTLGGTVNFALKISPFNPPAEFSS